MSNDNPFSEAWFKTLKYAPVFPDRFGSLQHARTFIDEFTQFYNHDHHHPGIGLHTPANVHYGLAAATTNAATTPWPQPGPRTRTVHHHRDTGHSQPARRSLDQPTTQETQQNKTVQQTAA
ncbi:integrase-like protein [Kribbella steppae]|uniref:Integrase-like protein n=1 Tax=Kribbella steppae TaxID=2512223 RepID=A0A4R2GYN9_9ACTN|nr:integrase-like protein [Kribbella steppae]